MNGIQIYLIIVIAVGALMSANKHGKPRENYDFWEYLSGLIFALPYIGRIFGWW